MVDWNAPLPATAVEGADTHVEDHNKLIAAHEETRANVDAVETAVEGKQDAGDYAPAVHKHDAGDIESGTFAAARIPTLAQSKVTGLSSALDSKADSADLAALVARVEALEAASTEPEPEV